MMLGEPPDRHDALEDDANSPLLSFDDQTKVVCVAIAVLRMKNLAAGDPRRENINPRYSDATGTVCHWPVETLRQKLTHDNEVIRFRAARLLPLPGQSSSFRRGGKDGRDGLPCTNSNYCP